MNREEMAEYTQMANEELHVQATLDYICNKLIGCTFNVLDEVITDKEQYASAHKLVMDTYYKSL